MLRTAGILPRLASLIYEALLLAAVLIVVSFPVAPLLQALPASWSRPFYQLFLLLTAGIYLSWFWRNGGQTLAMRAWRLKLVAASGDRVGLGQAWLRYCLAVLGLAAFGFGFLWALWDREHQFLHDRLAGTRLVRLSALHQPEGDTGAQGEDGQGR